MAEEIESLLASPGWTTLAAMIEEGRDNLRRTMERGAVLEQAEYARRMGFLDGTLVAVDMAREVKEAAAKRREKLADEAAEESERLAESRA